MSHEQNLFCFWVPELNIGGCCVRKSDSRLGQPSECGFISASVCANLSNAKFFAGRLGTDKEAEQSRLLREIYRCEFYDHDI